MAKKEETYNEAIEKLRKIVAEIENAAVREKEIEQENEEFGKRLEELD